MKTLHEVVHEAVEGQHAHGAVVAVHVEGEPVQLVSVNVDPNGLFAIGSVTKVMTATLVLQHVQLGDIGLDDPILDHIPTLRFDPLEDTSEVTIRHLLTHSSGIDCGDDLTDTGNGDDSLERFVDECISGSRFLHKPGASWSYSNCGFSLLGRLVEILDRRPWDDALISRLFQPLGLSATTTARLGPQQQMVMGHRFDSEVGAVIEDSRLAARGGGPAGSNLLATASDLVEFSHALLCGSGILLDPDLVREMIRPQRAKEQGSQALAWSLPSPGRLVHPGATGGFTSFLTARPGERALSVVADGPGAEAIATAVETHLYGALPAQGQGSVVATSVDPQACVGRFQRRHVTHEISFVEGRLLASTTFLGPIADFIPNPPDVALTPTGGALFEGRRTGDDLPAVFEFSDFSSEGRPSLLLTSNRLHARVSQDD